MLVKTKISVNSLELGMHVVELDRPWTDLPFALQDIHIKDDFEIQTLQKYCNHVFIEHDYRYSEGFESKGASSDVHSIPLESKVFSRKVKGLQPKASIDNELPRAYNVYIETKKHVKKIFDTVSNNGQIDIRKTHAVVNKCISSVVSNANALFWLTRIQDNSNKEADHSLRVSILSIALGHYVGLNRSQLEQLGIAALLHDIGKTRIPKDILNKRSAFSPAEKRVMEKHASLGYELLHADTSLAPIIKEVALHHHQRPDGKGYPGRHKNTPLSIYTRIVSIVDSYDDMTNEISHKQSISPRLALKELYQLKEKQFDIQLTKAFIKMLGIYPAGSLVKMTNGEVAMVIASDPKYKLTPKVEIIFDSFGKMRAPLIVDTNQSIKDDSGFPYKISGSLPDGTMGMDMNRYITERLSISDM